MLLIIKSKITKEELQKISKDLDGYVKIVVDIEQKILTAGGTRHVLGEEMLLNEGSKQRDLWGGGLDLETREIDFDSMINIRPNQENPSRIVLSQDIRNKMVKIIQSLLL